MNAQLTTAELEAIEQCLGLPSVANLDRRRAVKLVRAHREAITEIARLRNQILEHPVMEGA